MTIEVYNDRDENRFKSQHKVLTTLNKDENNKDEILLVLSGIVLTDFRGVSTERWQYETLDIYLNIAPYLPVNKMFHINQWTTFVTLNAHYNKNEAHHSGFAVDDFRLLVKGAISKTLVSPDQERTWEVLVRSTIAARDSDAYLYRVGYNLIMTGKYEPAII